MNEHKGGPTHGGDETTPGGGDWVDVSASSALADDSVIQVIHEGVPIALYRIQGRAYASHDICTHEFALLSQGYIEEECIECPLHQALFHIPTGRVEEGPATRALKTYAVREAAGRILIEFDGPPADDA